MGGVGGLLKGAGIATLAVGAFKGAQMLSEGSDMAKERDLTLDALKRQLGDLGVSFRELQEASETASQGLGVDAREFAKLAEQFTQASHGADRTPAALADETRGATGFARAYGMQPGAGVSFFGGMRAMDPRQNNRELALLLAEAIDRTGGRALASDVLQAVQSFAASTARLSLSSPNLAGFTGAYAGMLNQGGPGMTADNVASILGRANASISGLGAAGEAGQNFMLQAFNQAGGVINPLEARAQAAGGMFATRASIYGRGTKESPYTQYGQYLSDRGVDVKGLLGSEPDVTNFEAVRRLADKEFKGRPELELNAMQRLFGLSSPQQASALMGMRSEDMGGLGQLLQKSGVDIGSVNESGIRTLAKISGATSKDDLLGVYGNMAARTGKGALTDDDRRQLEAAKGGNTEDFRTLLAKIAATKDQEETQATDARDAAASLQTIQSILGEKIYPAMTTMKDYVVEIAKFMGVSPELMEGPTGKGSGLSDKQVSDLKSRRADLVEQMSKAANWFHYGETMKDPATGRELNAEETRAARQKELDDINRQLSPQTVDAGSAKVPDADTTSGKTPATSKTPASFTPERAAQLNATERKYNLPAGLLRGVYGTESSFGKNTGVSSAGAEGHFQFMKETAARYGVKIGDFDSEQEGAGHYLSDLIKRRHGDVKAALRDYDGVKKNIAAGNDYIAKVQHNGNVKLDGTKDQFAQGLDPDPKIVELPSERDPSGRSYTGSVSKDGTKDQFAQGLDPDPKIVELPPERDPSGRSYTGSVSKQAKSARGSGQTEAARDTVILDINMNVISGNGGGSSTVHQVNTSFDVPRGSGVQRATISN
ncbi:transglycosylase SLT domain-containing protein [Paraburkholderia sp. MM6662-R1]|uniref:transglycosylase SLT domain-containing protein n=1 Tax=Paraburkholderia sp. MM6662-R1 TaxID=2991066 RepID=UPI003D1AA457